MNPCSLCSASCSIIDLEKASANKGNNLNFDFDAYHTYEDVSHTCRVDSTGCNRSIVRYGMFHIESDP